MRKSAECEEEISLSAHFYGMLTMEYYIKIKMRTKAKFFPAQTIKVI